MKLFCFFFMTLMSASSLAAQSLPAYKDAHLPVETRVKDLLARMTPEEKFWQLFMIPGDLDGAKPHQYAHGLFGFQVSATTANAAATEQLIGYNTKENGQELAEKINRIQQYFVEQTRLGIPIIAFDEALHGLVRKGATAFPQSIGMAASFDTSLMAAVAKAIAIETKQRGIRQVLSPVINIATDVRWGRTEETFGEDPYLTSAMATAYIQAFEQMGILTTPKHFLANVGDGGRDSYPIHWNERLLREIHLPPFKAAIAAGASSVMTSYNSLDGSPATANDWLLNQLLKKEYGFKGFVISDASAVGGANVLHYTAKDYADAGMKAINKGLDVIFQTQYEHYRLFIAPFLDGSIVQQRLDDAVARVLRAKFMLGLFEHPYIDMAPKPTTAAQHRALAETAAAKSFVLLQNNHQILPLKADSIQQLLVVGKDAVAARLGGYSGTGQQVINIVEGLQQALPKSTKIRYMQGVAREDSFWQIFPTKYLYTDATLSTHGLQGRYYKNVQPQANPAAQRVDAAINFSWTLYGPDNLGVSSFYSVVWTGFVQTDSSALYQLAVAGNDGYRLYINEQMVVNRWSKQSYHQEACTYYFEKGKAYAIRLEFYEPIGNGKIQLLLHNGKDKQINKNMQEAVEAGKQADAIIVVAGITEGEFSDRASLHLPGHQEALITAMANTGKPVIVLLVAGSAVHMQQWLSKVQAVVQIWYAGETGGAAVAGMLLGKTNPAGRMPFTTPLEESQLPLVYHHKPTGRGDDYNNLSGQPLFPFGYGLSYTNFAYSQLQVPTKVAIGMPIIVQCSITNMGSCAGDEVVQLYTKDDIASVATPVQLLQGFQRISLQPKQTKVIQFTISPQQLQLFNEQMQCLQEPGTHTIMIGASSRDIRLQAKVLVE